MWLTSSKIIFVPKYKNYFFCVCVRADMLVYIMMSWHWHAFCIICPFVQGIHRLSADSRQKGPVKQSFDAFSVVSLHKLFNKQLISMPSRGVFCGFTAVWGVYWNCFDYSGRKVTAMMGLDSKDSTGYDFFPNCCYWVPKTGMNFPQHTGGWDKMAAIFQMIFWMHFL